MNKIMENIKEIDAFSIKLLRLNTSVSVLLFTIASSIFILCKNEVYTYSNLIELSSSLLTGSVFMLAGGFVISLFIDGYIKMNKKSSK